MNCVHIGVPGRIAVVMFLFMIIDSNQVSDQQLEEAKEAVLEYVRYNRGASFVELEDVLKEKGLVRPTPEGTSEVIKAHGYENIILWESTNSLIVEAFISLVAEGKVVPHPTHELVYLMDGKSLAYPLVKKAKDYKETHWLPITLSLPA